jgi:predicted small secreted protein
MKNLKKAIICLILAITCVGASTACRTAHGFGEDMEKAGEKIQEKTDK